MYTLRRSAFLARRVHQTCSSSFSKGEFPWHIIRTKLDGKFMLGRHFLTESRMNKITPILHISTAGVYCYGRSHVLALHVIW